MVTKGWYTHREGEWLAWMAERMPTAPVVELGTAWGRSASYILAGTDARMVCVDTWPDTSVLDEFRFALKNEGWEDRVTTLHQSSQEAAGGWDGRIGLLHIDASHKYEDVLSDYRLWAPDVQEGGWIVFHDSHTPGVRQVLREVVEPQGWWTKGHMVNNQWSAQRRG